MATLPIDVQDALQKSCVRARKARKPFRFFYCPAGEDGQPVLMLAKRLNPGELRSVRRGAQQKKYLTGEVQSEEGRLVLVPGAPGPSARLKKHLKSWFGPGVPLLRRAIVRDGDEEAPDTEGSGFGGDVDEAEARLQKVVAEVAQAEQAEQDALARVEALTAEVAAAKAAWEDLGMDAEKAGKQYNKRVKQTTSTLNWMRDRFSSSDTRRRRQEERQSAEHEALWAYDDAMEKADQGRRAYERLLTSLSEAQAALNAGQETLHRLDAEALLANAEAGRVHAALEATRGEGAERTRTLNESEDALEAAIAADPLLGPLQKEAVALEDEADRLSQEATTLQMAMEERQAERATLLAAIQTEPDDGQLHRLAELEKQLLADSTRLDTIIAGMSSTEEAAQSARSILDEAITTSDNRAILKADRRRQRARKELERVDAAEVALELGLDSASDRVEESGRLRRFEEVAIQARAAIASHADFYAIAGSIDPRSDDHVKAHPDILGKAEAVNALADVNHFYDLLTEADATADELKAIFAPVPGPWRPAALAEHLQWFVKLDAWEQKMAENEADEALLKEIESDLSGSGSLAIVDADAEKLRNELEREIKLLGATQGGGLVSLLPRGAVDQMIIVMQLINAGMDARNSVRDLSGKPDPKVFDRETGEYVDVDPVTQKMRDEQLMSALAALGPLGLNVLGAVTDAIGHSLTGPTQIVKAEALYRQIKEATTRIGRSLKDSALLETAREENHVASEAIEQSRDQERRKAARAAVGAALKTIDLGADFALIAGQGATAAAVCKIAAVSGDFTNRAVHTANDFRIAKKARDLFEKARDESLTPEKRAAAARKLFKFSQKHAKGILAWLAQEGDPIALKYSRARGLTDDEIRKTSPAVLQRFLLQRAGEGQGEQQTFDEWLDALIQSWKDRFARIGKLVRSSSGRLVNWMDAINNGKLDAKLAIRPIPAQAIEALASALRRLIDRHRFLVSRPRTPRIDACLKRLEDARGTFDREVIDKRSIIAENLATLARYRDEIREKIPRADPDTEPVWKGAESRIAQLTTTNIERMRTLSALG